MRQLKFLIVSGPGLGSQGTELLPWQVKGAFSPLCAAAIRSPMSFIGEVSGTGHLFAGKALGNVWSE